MKLKAYLRKLRAQRKGAAMEMAIMLLVVAFSLSTLVLTISLLQHTRQLRTEREVQRSIVLEQIGESFCSAVVEGESHSWVTLYPDYDITVSGLTLTVADLESDEVFLTVELTEQDGKYTLTQWNKR